MADERCPDCHVLSVEGYMSHKTDCPQRAKERQIRAHMAANPASDGMDAGSESFWAPGHGAWWSELIDAIRWRLRQVEWKTVLFVAVALGITCVLLWLGLGAMEER